MLIRDQLVALLEHLDLVAIKQVRLHISWQAHILDTDGFDSGSVCVGSIQPLGRGCWSLFCGVLERCRRMRYSFQAFIVGFWESICCSEELNRKLQVCLKS